MSNTTTTKPHPVRKAREKRSWSLEFLAERSGINNATFIVAAEQGKEPIRAHRQAIAAALSEPQGRLWPGLTPVTDHPLPDRDLGPLQKARWAKAWTVAELAHKARVPAHVISDMERRGKVPIGNHRYLISAALGRKQSALFPGSAEAPDPASIRSSFVPLVTPPPVKPDVTFPPNNVRAIRERQRLSLQQLAGQACMHVQHLELVEESRKELSYDFACRLAEVLHVTEHELSPAFAPRRLA